MIYFAYIVLGFLPSIVWLLFYLKKDLHPEPKRMLTKVFGWGMLSAIPTLLISLGTQSFWERFDIFIPVTIATFFNIFIGVALIEELLKYLIIQGEVLKNKEFDEPVDAMIYMIVAALGFAAAENVLYLLPCSVVGEAFFIAIGRFLGATCLHALCSAIVGYFLALAYFKKEKRKKLIFLGLGISTVLHGLYNFSIIEEEGYLKILIPVIILIGSSIFVSKFFKQLKSMGKC